MDARIAMPRNRVRFTSRVARAMIQQRREQLIADREDIVTRLQARGVRPQQQITVPPSDEELICDYWWLHGAIVTLDDLLADITGDEAADDTTL